MLFRRGFLRKPETTRDAFNRAAATIAVINETMADQAKYASRVLAQIPHDARCEPVPAKVRRRLQKALLLAQQHRDDVAIEMAKLAKHVRSWDLRAAAAARTDLEAEANKWAHEGRWDLEMHTIDHGEYVQLIARYKSVMQKIPE